MVLDFCRWLENSSLGSAIRDSVWLFPAVEAVHLIALAIIGGAVLMVDLKLLGLGLRRQAAGQLAEDARPWMVRSLLVMIASGLVLFASEATKCYETPAFWYKIAALVTAIIFTFTARAAVLSSETSAFESSRRGKAVAIVSLTLWSVVGMAGRAIGFY